MQLQTTSRSCLYNGLLGIYYLAAMSRYHSYVHTAATIIDTYKADIPFASHLKKFFSHHSKHGSRDRKAIGQLCFGYYRLGRIGMDFPIDDRILLGLFLCSNEENEILSALKKDWSEKTGCSIYEKLRLATREDSLHLVFPWKGELSNGIEYESFCKSFFYQPDLFIRVRPGYEKIVNHKLSESGFFFKEMGDNCIALPNSSKIDAILELDKVAVVQDYSSQKTGGLLSLLKTIPVKKVWDCCAASGGKSIMAWDAISGIELIVSDIRESILTNLKKRFAIAGINKFRSFVIDLSRADTNKQVPLSFSELDLVICDVPCTGSGTWGRAPEHLYYFDEKKIDRYADLQKKIVSNVLPYLKDDGYILYSTCSVFKKENEEVVSYLQDSFQLDIVQMNIIPGYEHKADTMFAALMKNTGHS
ncbi:MAG TPA: Fmu (Sun) domain-containing protein [Chitinophagaceae bacterium]|nr:Fmu (Sun) domain-containing protein [Chitinophagaceae bacterium]